ncbi:pneumococcal serine-rich repeat protein [Colossoma macropomum]|uniref:pneumococcal serine-rich repeat protein n=1 Tax=Colossoma macropomum TaxID=42526 RepID=UPI0018644249|nr:pneumococcal serine-rich repeat protein [Colossoma macropomum]
MMMQQNSLSLLSAFVSLVLVVLAESSVGPSNSSSSYCTESKECLQFDLVCRTEEYEVRHYSPTRWVATDAEAYFMGVGAAMAFRRLYQYITGANEGGVEIEMTAPVLVKVPEETQMWEPAIYTLSFLLPSAFQHNPPTPTSDKLYFTDMPEMNVYVRSYGGWMLSITSRLHAHLLTKELNRVGANYNHTHHYAVGYDSPLKLLNRHNEVWYVAEDEPVCSGATQKPTQNPTATDKPNDAAFTASDKTATATNTDTSVASNATTTATSPATTTATTTDASPASITATSSATITATGPAPTAATSAAPTTATSTAPTSAAPTTATSDTTVTAAA